MGHFKGFFAKNFFYVVDLELLRYHLKSELQFSIDNKLEASAKLDIYYNGEKHNIEILNYSASRDKKERNKGVVVYFDDFEFATVDEMIMQKLNNLPQFFKIDLIYCDSVELNEYMEKHPELRVEDY